MKKYLSIILVGLLVVSGLGLSITAIDIDETRLMTEKIKISKPIITQDEQYVLVNLKESESFLIEDGKPMLPMITRTFTFPLGTKIKNVDINYNTVEEKLSSKIKPSPRAIPLISTIKTDDVKLIDEDVYNSDSFYPNEPYIITKGAGKINGENVLILNIKIPLQYSPANDIILLPNDEIDIQIEYQKPDHPFFSGLEEYDLLIITPEKFAGKLQRLVNHKNSIGTKTILKTTEDIYQTYTEGRDNAEKIKLCIYDMKETYNIKYVLLAGGRQGQTFNWYIPERVTHNNDGWEAGYASDLYYADIYKVDPDTQEIVFEDWDDNGNGIFDEWSMMSNKKDKPDYYPDVSIGRISFRYVFEIDTVVDKIIKYETTVDDSWFKNAIVISGDTFPPSRGAHASVYEGELETGVSADLLESIGFNVERLWTSNGGFSSTKDVTDAITSGPGFVHIAGHGNPAYWGNFLPDAETEAGMIDGLMLKDMSKLKNGYKLPVIVVGGCHNGQFNTTMANILKDILEYGISGYFFESPHRFYYKEWVPREFCSWLVMQKGGGAIGSMGNSGLGYGYVDEYTLEGLGGWIEPRFFDAYANQSIHVLGEIHDKAIIDYIDIIGNVQKDQIDRKTIEEWTLMGDPSIKLGE